MKTVLIALSLMTATFGISSFAAGNADDLVPADQLAIEIGDTMSSPELDDGDAKAEPPFECVTINARGEHFEARGWRPFYTQRRATDKCYAKSEFCRPRGCHHVVYPR